MFDKKNKIIRKQDKRKISQAKNCILHLSIILIILFDNYSANDI